jgi:Tfp pilus assembly protein PilF
VADIHHARGRLFQKTGRAPEAEWAFRLCLERLEGLLRVCPSEPGHFAGLASFLAEGPCPALHDLDRALDFAQQAVRLAPDNKVLRERLGMVHYRRKEFKECVAVLEPVTQAPQSETVSGFLFLAMAHGQLGNQERARRSYEQAVAWMDKNQPRNPELARLRAEAAESLGIDPGQPPGGKEVWDKKN